MKVYDTPYGDIPFIGSNALPLLQRSSLLPLTSAFTPMLTSQANVAVQQEAAPAAAIPGASTQEFAFPGSSLPPQPAVQAPPVNSNSRGSDGVPEGVSAPPPKAAASPEKTADGLGGISRPMLLAAAGLIGAFFFLRK